MSQDETIKVDMPRYVTVEGTPYMRADIGHEMLSELEKTYKLLSKIVDGCDTGDISKVAPLAIRAYFIKKAIAKAQGEA